MTVTVLSLSTRRNAFGVNAPAAALPTVRPGPEACADASLTQIASVSPAPAAAVAPAEEQQEMSTPLPKSRLGRGLASLIGDPALAQPKLPPEGEQRLVPIDQVRGGKLNPRREFDQGELAELAESIRHKGLVQPLLVRPDRISGGYEIVAGERRWRAAQLAAQHVLPVIVRDLSDQEVLELHLWEGLEPREIADVLGLTTAVVRPRLSRARARLRELLGNDPEPPGHSSSNTPELTRKEWR